MGPFLVFFSIICFTAGIITWVFAFALFFKQKGAIEKSFLFFLSIFLIIMFLAAILFNFEAELLKNPALLFSMGLASRLLTVVLLFSLTNFAQLLVGKAQSKTAKIIFYSISALLFIGTALYHLVFVHRADINTIRQVSLPDFILYLAGVYAVILIVKYYRNIENETLRGIVRSFGIAILILFPITILDEFNLTLTISPGIITPVEIQFLFFPFTYLVFNLMLLYHGFKHYIQSRDTQGSTREVTVTEQFVNQYNITLREKELMMLLIEGYSNQQIADKLFISAATVRNHLHNIFEKTGVKSRTGLVRIAVQG